MLPDPALQPAYSKVVWLYVYRDFSNSESDLAAERISLRFGLTSWPQLLLVHPETLHVIGGSGRTVASFQSAVDRATKQVQPTKSLAAAEAIDRADARAIEIEKNPTVELARESLADSDIVVRVRALNVLAEQAPDVVATEAKQLLAVRNDPFRYKVCQVLAKSANGKTANGKSADGKSAVDALEELVKRPTNSRNPNVLRINAVGALGACGDKGSVEVIAPFASSGEFLNGLTGTSVNALVAIAERDQPAQKAVRDILIRSYPEPPADATAIQARYCVSLAKRVHTALERLSGTKVDFPDEYNRATRRELMGKWQ